LHVIQQFPTSPAVPSKLVDLVWHEHILDTQQYEVDSQRMFGKYVHHAPSFGDDESETVIAQKQEMVQQQHEMLQQYVELFGDQPSAVVWPRAQETPVGAGRLPDCCKAECAKVNCVQCVGCNAVYCGKLQAKLPSVQHVLPDHFSGYVPHVNQSLVDAPSSYKCQMSPTSGMTYSWTISGNYIYSKQTFSTSQAETWHSIGFTDVYPYNMGYADYIISMFGTNNYTGIRDLYKYDAGNHYPCWDVLTQCSAEGKAGTMDLLDRETSRQNGQSISSWTRLLNTVTQKIR